MRLQTVLTGFALIVPVVIVGYVSSVNSGHVVASVGTPTESRQASDVQATPVEESMHEFMEYVFQPTYRRLKQNVATAPADNNGWKAIKSDALILAECCNLLYDRRPEKDGEDWVVHASGARQEGAGLYNAAKVRDYEKTKAAWTLMLEKCNDCHVQFENGKHILQP